MLDMQDNDFALALKHGLLGLTAAATVAMPFLSLPGEVTKLWRPQFA